jgi:hypothetical protein
LPLRRGSGCFRCDQHDLAGVSGIRRGDPCRHLWLTHFAGGAPPCLSKGLVGYGGDRRACLGSELFLSGQRLHVELSEFAAIMTVVRNGAAGFKGRAITSPHGYEQIPTLVERGEQRFADFQADQLGLSHRRSSPVTSSTAY